MDEKLLRKLTGIRALAQSGESPEALSAQAKFKALLRKADITEEEFDRHTRAVKKGVRGFYVTSSADKRVLIQLIASYTGPRVPLVTRVHRRWDFLLDETDSDEITERYKLLRKDFERAYELLIRSFIQANSLYPKILSEEDQDLVTTEVLSDEDWQAVMDLASSLKETVVPVPKERRLD